MRALKQDREENNFSHYFPLVAAFSPHSCDRPYLSAFFHLLARLPVDPSIPRFLQ